MNFWCHFTETLGIGLNDLEKYFTADNLNISSIRALIYSGLIAYDQEEKNPIDYDKMREEFDWLYKCYEKTFGEIPKEWHK